MPRKPSAIDYRLLSKVSKYYYEEGLNQQDIAEKLFLSRPKVSRLLQQALDEGVVKITVIPPPYIHQDVEDRLEKKYHLKEAVVVETSNPDSPDVVSMEVGQAAAEYFMRTLRSGDRIGISWGSTLSAMVRSLQPQDIEDIHIVQVIGGLGFPEREVHATNICQQISRLLDAKLTLLPAPGIVDSKAVKNAILSDSHMQNIYKLFESLDVAYVGIGAPTPDSVLMRGGSIMSQAELDNLLAHGAVGDIALRFFDHAGHHVHTELDDRVIGIDIDHLKKIKRVVGLAGGPQKVETIHAALKGKLVNTLITEYATAMKLLEMD